MGITDYAQNSLGDIVFVELPKVGDTIEAGKIFGSVESVKAVSDLYCAGVGHGDRGERGVEGRAGEDQRGCEHDLDAEGGADGSRRELDALLTAADYEKFVSEETGH